jgi:hypothetical protein
MVTQTKENVVATLNQEIEARKIAVEKQTKRDRLNRWLELAEDFDFDEKLDTGNVPRLILTIEITTKNFRDGKLPKQDYDSKGVHIG